MPNWDRRTVPVNDDMQQQIIYAHEDSIRRKNAEILKLRKIVDAERDNYLAGYKAGLFAATRMFSECSLRLTDHYDDVDKNGEKAIKRCPE